MSTTEIAPPHASPIAFGDELTVEFVEAMGTELRIQESARASLGDSGGDELNEGLVRHLIRSKHTSTLEHCAATFIVQCPIFVTREFMRHRTMSYNELSGRYKELEPSFYIPSRNRPLVNIGSSARPNLVQGDISDEDYAEFINDQLAVYDHATKVYQKWLDRGIAKEVARNVLPVAINTRFMVTANLNNWMRFLALRDGLEGHPQWEIVQVANQIKEKLTELYPIAMSTWQTTREIPDATTDVK